MVNCIRAILKDKGEHLRININMVCTAQKPTLNYLMDSLGRKLYDISDKLLICGTQPPLFDYLMDNMGRKLYDISGKLLLEKE